MQQSLSLPLTAVTFFLRLISLPSAALERYWTLPKLSKQVLVTFTFHQAVELFAHFLDLLFGHDLGIDETDDRHSVDIFQSEETARALRHRETPVEDGNRTEPGQR